MSRCGCSCAPRRNPSILERAKKALRTPTLGDFKLSSDPELGERLWPFVKGQEGAAYSVAQHLRAGNRPRLDTTLIAISNLSAENESLKSKKLSEIIGLLAAMASMATFR